MVAEIHRHEIRSRPVESECVRAGQDTAESGKFGEAGGGDGCRHDEGVDGV